MYNIDQHTDKTLQPVITSSSHDPVTISGCEQLPDFVGELLQRRPDEEVLQLLRGIFELGRSHPVGISAVSSTPVSNGDHR